MEFITVIDSGLQEHWIRKKDIDSLIIANLTTGVRRMTIHLDRSFIAVEDYEEIEKVKKALSA